LRDTLLDLKAIRSLLSKLQNLLLTSKAKIKLPSLHRITLNLHSNWSASIKNQRARLFRAFFMEHSIPISYGR